MDSHFILFLSINLFLLLSTLYEASSSPKSHFAKSTRIRSYDSMPNGGYESCGTGNPVDDCWRCDPDWANNRQHLVNCSIGFGSDAMRGVKNVSFYIVTDSGDEDVVNTHPGTLRDAVIQDNPLWIVFASDMTIHLNEELIMNSYKVVDGRGRNVRITGGASFVIQNVEHVIIESISIDHIIPTGNANVRSSPSHFGYRRMADGDGISIMHSMNVWIDHCSLSFCADGLIDVVSGSTSISITNCFFSNHDKVMLLGGVDSDYDIDRNMLVTVAYNHFAPDVTQRLPRIRAGKVIVVNNFYSGWRLYALGGDADGFITSRGNIYVAPPDKHLKNICHIDIPDNLKYAKYNWMSIGDEFRNGAIFTPMGSTSESDYPMSPIVFPTSKVEVLTSGAGVTKCPEGERCLR